MAAAELDLQLDPAEERRPRMEDDAIRPGIGVGEVAAPGRRRR